MHTDKDSHLFTIVSSFRVVVHCMGQGPSETTSTMCRSCHEEGVEQHATSTATIMDNNLSMVPIKRYKENNNIEINTPLIILMLQQEVQMFHW